MARAPLIEHNNEILPLMLQAAKEPVAPDDDFFRSAVERFMSAPTGSVQQQDLQSRRSRPAPAQAVRMTVGSQHNGQAAALSNACYAYAHGLKAATMADPPGGAPTPDIEMVAELVSPER